jgi:hypothetical protein
VRRAVLRSPLQQSHEANRPRPVARCPHSPAARPWRHDSRPPPWRYPSFQAAPGNWSRTFRGPGVLPGPGVSRCGLLARRWACFQIAGTCPRRTGRSWTPSFSGARRWSSTSATSKCCRLWNSSLLARRSPVSAEPEGIPGDSSGTSFAPRRTALERLPLPTLREPRRERSPLARAAQTRAEPGRPRRPAGCAERLLARERPLRPGALAHRPCRVTRLPVDRRGAPIRSCTPCRSSAGGRGARRACRARPRCSGS